MFTEKVSVYFFSGVGPLAGLAPPAGCAGGGFGVAAAFAGAGTVPNANERLMPMFTEKKLGPIP